jgi:hypothetical protein
MAKARRHLTRQRGSSLATTLIALPVLGALVGGAVQLGLMFEAKSTLNHAALQAARAGMVDNASEASLELGLARGLLPLYSPSEDLVDVGNTLVCEVTPEVITNACIRIINPNREAFAEYAETIDDVEQIPNDELHRRPRTIGGRSGLTIQDANLLKVYVEYGAPMRVPIIGPLFARTLLLSDQLSGFQKSQLQQNRLPLVASATVRMQSPLIENTLMLNRDELLSGDFCGAPAVTDEIFQCLLDKGAGTASAALSCGMFLASKFRDKKAGRACAVGAADVAICFAPSIVEYIEDLRFALRCGS